MNALRQTLKSPEAPAAALSSGGLLQRKLMIGAANDLLECEAERVADQVLGMPAYSRLGNTSPQIQRYATQADGAQAVAPASVARALSGNGASLDDGQRKEMERRFGCDFSGVRTHTGPAAERSARDVNARAYTVGHHIVFGSGQFNPASAAGRRLLAHELTHVVQQNPAAPVLRRSVESDVKDKLSYGFLDWAITDTEALDSLSLLDSLPDAELAAALKNLGDKYVNRLLDNLPDAAKTGKAYARLIKTLGVAGTRKFATEQLNYGIFDWAITDAEVARVFNIYSMLPESERENFLAGLQSAGRLGRLLDNSSIGLYRLHIEPWMDTLIAGRLTPRQQTILRTAVEELPGEGMQLLVKMTKLRYDVDIGPTTIPGRTPVAWEFGKLRETYLALDRLPEAHVARNRELLRFGQFTQEPQTSADDRKTATVAGVYVSGQKELAANVKASEDIATSMIHETGHAVDAEMGWSAGQEPAKPERGGWKSYGTRRDGATDMVDSSNGGIKNKLDAAQRNDAIADMTQAMGTADGSGLTASIRARPWFGGLPGASKDAVLDDPVIPAIRIGLGTGTNGPWFAHPDGGQRLGVHIYQQSYPLKWVRYMFAARSRMVTQYQFRAPGEWFAECYAAYYSPENRGKGEKLEKKDPDTKRYFDNHVDNRAASR